MKGRRQVKEGCSSHETIETLIVSVCHSEGEWAQKNWKKIWTRYGTRCQAQRFVSRTATLLLFSRPTVSRVYQERSTILRTSNQLDTTVGSIGFNMGQHLGGTLLTPCRVHARLLEDILRAKRKFHCPRLQHSIPSSKLPLEAPSAQ
jgi:hypothetical protein